MDEKSGIHNLTSKVGPVLSFLKKHSVLVVLIAVLALQWVPNNDGSLPWGGMWMRMGPQGMPFADSIAQQSVSNFVSQQAQQMAKVQYPNLPDSNLQKVIGDLTQKILTENAAQLVSERNRLASEIREHYSYEENGRKFGYMPDIDPYFYLRNARNVLEKGHTYDELRDGVPTDALAIAPVGANADNSWHPYTYVVIFQIMSIFSGGISLMEASAFFPIVFIFASLILAFFIALRVSGKIGAVVATTMLAIIPAVMGRTPWGHADTDAYQVFFPLLIVLLLFIAIDAKSWKSRAAWAGLAGAVLGLYTKFWTGYWYIFDFVAGALVIAFLIELVIHRNRIFSNFKSLWTDTHLKYIITIGLSFLVGSTIVGSLLIGPSRFLKDIFLGAFGFTTIRNAAQGIWPSVFTTVAELNPSSFSGTIAAVGGTLFFIIACIGIVLLFLQKEERNYKGIVRSALLAIWFVGTIYASIKGVRFTILLGPAFAIAFACGVSFIYRYLASFGERSLHVNRAVTGAIVLIVASVLMVSPVSGNMVKQAYAQANAGAPLVNDAWWNTLTKIKTESQPNAIITSWWDFGHHFKYIADRGATHDGAAQNGPTIHWVGRMSQTDDENEAVGILRMLACGNYLAGDVALKETNNDSLLAVKLVKEIIVEDKEKAAQTLKEKGYSDEILKYTHCDPPENFYIASEDMIGKAGVWTHFGLWDFDKAEVWAKWRNMKESEVVSQMSKRFEISEDDAKKLYREAKSLSSEDAANNWIGPYQQYLTGAQGCSPDKGLWKCGNIIMNLTDKRVEVKINNGVAVAGHLIVYERTGAKQVFNYSEGNSQLTVVAWPVAGGNINAIAATAPLADSMFTRMFYMGGLGLKHFKPFSSERQLIGGMIHTYKVDWDGKDVYVPNEISPKSVVEPNAAVTLNYIGWTDDGVFDSSIADWKEKNVTPETSFEGQSTHPLQFVTGTGKLIPGFEKGIQGMKPGETRVITVSPEEGYGTDPAAHPLGNKTLKFKINVVSVS